MNNSRSVPKDSWRCSRSVNLTERQADHSVPAFFLKSQPYTWNNGFPQAKYHPLIIANMEIWGSKCATYHHHLEVLFYFHSLSSLHLFLLFYHQPSDCSQKPKLFPWFNDPHPWRVCSAEPGTGMCLNSVFDGISQFETRTERTLSDTLETQHLRFLLRRFCCCWCYCKTFTFCFLTRLKFKLNIFRWILQTGVSKTRLWSETHGLLLYDETKHWNYISNT